MKKHFQSTNSKKFAISLQYLKKEVSNGVYFLHADKHQSFYKLGLLFLMEVARYVESTRNRKLVLFLHYILRKECRSCFSALLWYKTIRYFMGLQSCLLLLVSLHSQTVEIVCLNNAIQRLNSNYVERSCQFCWLCSKLMFFKKSRIYCNK